MTDFLIVFSPKTKKPNRRFLVSINQLKKYIGKNDIKVIKAVQNLTTNKTTLRFRKFGKIEIYLK